MSNKYEAKYRVLSMGATSEQVEAAEKLVELAIKLASEYGVAFIDVFTALVEVVKEQQKENAMNILGVQVE